MVDISHPEDPALGSVFAALADPIRRAMIGRLAEGPATVGELGRGFPISKQAVSRHVMLLERAGLLERRIQGRIHRCQLSTQPLARIENWIQGQRRAWHRSLNALEQHLRSLGWNGDSS